jgi:flavin reductase (DIM6/NTAB) family NADH-FMN oxidoreductase RutF
MNETPAARPAHPNTQHPTPITSADAVGAFKQAARRFATGVTVVTTRQGRDVYGLTVSAFATLSIDPLQVLVSIRTGNRLHEMIRESGVFAINILREEQRPISQYFAQPGRPTCIDAFPEIATGILVTGAPVIDDCLAHFDCRLAATLAGGDHAICIGDVVAACGSDGHPLLYFNGDYRGLRDWGTAAPATLDLWYV